MKLNQTILSVAILGLLSACGGGGAGSSSGNGGSTGVLPPANTLANLCASPRANSVDRQGTADNEKAYLRSFVDETYLWYKDVPSNLIPASYANPQLYFDALKTSAKTASGKNVDQFHWSQTTASWDAAQSGISEGYGITWKGQLQNKPYFVVVADVLPASPATQAGIKRGDILTTVDGVNLADSNNVDAILEALFPSKLVTHKFGFNSKPETVFIPTQVNVLTVQNLKIIQTANGKIGYFTFDTHIDKAVAELTNAIAQLKAANVTDLVLDLRYNGGGLLSIASQLAYMIAGPSLTNGLTFERLVYNDKLTAQNQTIQFYNSTQTGQALPYLGLKRVTVLTTQNTASASESIINGLRGVDVQVDIIGSATRGKPYGFVPQNNCGWTYFAIQFKGVNNKGYGDYADGFEPTCKANDDFTHFRGDVEETMLKTALTYRQTGVCPVSANVQSRNMSESIPLELLRSPASEMRIVDKRIAP